jgi:hypothetical protein
MDRRDLVITAITGYTFKHIAPWVNSLERSGFSGIKAIVCYNVSHTTIQELVGRGFAVFAFQKDPITGHYSYPNQNFSIVVERFLHYWAMLNTSENSKAVRYVIATDAKDVIFQKNPSDYLDTLNPFNEYIVASSEGIQYENEPWGVNNMTQAFGPIMYEKHKKNGIINCGVLAGSFDLFMGLCKTIYLSSLGSVQHVPGGGGPDQAALNLILDTAAYRSRTIVTTHRDTWAAQLGTTMDPNKIEAYRPHLTDPQPVFDKESGLVLNASGNPYTLVHQWDRVPEVRAAVERLYR